MNYTDSDGNTVVERYTVSGDPDVADPGSAARILAIPQPFANHNGGQLAFGPDDLLCVFTGDGGGAGDPFETGQDPSDLLGSILRLDVDGGDPYAIPPDNPFVGVAGARPEVWAIGLRNPWRSWFDMRGGTLYVADVGQSQREEVNAVGLDAGGVNYGWNLLEGTACFAEQGCDATGTEPPVLEYTHADGCSITGGVVYRGASSRSSSAIISIPTSAPVFSGVSASRAERRSRVGNGAWGTSARSRRSASTPRARCTC